MVIIETAEELKAFRDRRKKAREISKKVRAREYFKIWYSKPENKKKCRESFKIWYSKPENKKKRLFMARERRKRPECAKKNRELALAYYYRNRDKILAKKSWRKYKMKKRRNKK